MKSLVLTRAKQEPAVGESTRLRGGAQNTVWPTAQVRTMEYVGRAVCGQDRSSNEEVGEGLRFSSFDRGNAERSLVNWAENRRPIGAKWNKFVVVGPG